MQTIKLQIIDKKKIIIEKLCDLGLGGKEFFKYNAESSTYKSTNYFLSVKDIVKRMKGEADWTEIFIKHTLLTQNLHLEIIRNKTQQ